MPRARKRHVQQSLPMPHRRDKNGQLRGGARDGAGRPKKPKEQGRASERHRVRPAIKASQPIHVIMRAAPSIGTLRKDDVFGAVRHATRLVARHHEETFRIVHLSLQRTHIHMIVEANDRRALWQGMKAFGISVAKQINALIGERTGERRRGSVFADRYHAAVLSTPKQVRNTLAYVLQNWKHHGEHDKPMQRAWKIDPYSSAIGFDGWKERDGVPFRLPEDYEALFVWRPRTWLLKVGWRRWGLISIAEIPGGGSE